MRAHVRKDAKRLVRAETTRSAGSSRTVSGLWLLLAGGRMQAHQGACLVCGVELPRIKFRAVLLPTPEQCHAQHLEPLSFSYHINPLKVKPPTIPVDPYYRPADVLLPLPNGVTG